MSMSSGIDFSPADVLIIGAGASGATAAWNLAETKMRIVCLEQGGWTNPSNYPTTGRDWESRAQSDFSINPNRRQQPGDYPVNDDDSPIKIANLTAWVVEPFCMPVTTLVFTPLTLRLSL